MGSRLQRHCYPLSAGVLYPAFMLSPAMGEVLMSLSTVVVAINAKLLKLK